MSDMISREAVASLLMQHAVYRRECARKADEVGHDTWADMNREAAEALLGVLAVIRDLPAVQPDAGAIRDKVLREVLGNLGGVELFGSTPQDTHAALEQWCRCRDMIYALIDKPGKEVRPDVEDTHHARPDTAPAGLSAGGGADWQPIETAPKDGIAFLGYWPDVADFGEADNACEVRTWWNETEQRYESCFETASSDSEPTHWMPRPSPPSTEGGA